MEEWDGGREEGREDEDTHKLDSCTKGDNSDKVV